MPTWVEIFYGIALGLLAWLGGSKGAKAAVHKELNGAPCLKMECPNREPPLLPK